VRRCETGRRAEGLEHLVASEVLYQRVSYEAEAARVKTLLHKYDVHE
jgi:hypothetical protein